MRKKRMGATNVGVCRAHPFFVVTVLTPATTETEDSPTVSSCPTIYIATRVPCKALFVEEYEDYEIPIVLSWRFVLTAKVRPTTRQKQRIYFKVGRKIFTMSQSRLPALFGSRLLIPLHVFQFRSGSRPQSLPVPAIRFRNNARVVALENRAQSL